MKINVIILTISLMPVIVLARVMDGFHGWSALKKRSPYIAVVCCSHLVPPSPGILMEGGPKTDVEIKTISVLKGVKDVMPSRLWTDCSLIEGENYLVFGYCDGKIYRAYEEYRIIPLENGFNTNEISGKTLDEQVQILLKLRLDNLNRKLKNEEEEKQRLEEGLEK